MKKIRLTLSEKRAIPLFLLIGGFVVAAVDAHFYNEGGTAGWLIYVALGMIVFSLLLPHLWLRCPRCRKSLLKRRGRINGFPTYSMVDVCPHCGMNVNWWKRYP